MEEEYLTFEQALAVPGTYYVIRNGQLQSQCYFVSIINLFDKVGGTQVTHPSSTKGFYVYYENHKWSIETYSSNAPMVSGEITYKKAPNLEFSIRLKTEE